MQTDYSRRHFIETTIAASGGLLLASAPRLAAAPRVTLPVAVFSKVCQELKLSYEQSAEVVAAAGLDGIDCPVRPGGEVLPEQAADQMPSYAEALARHKLKLLLLTTAITGISSPSAETILRTAKKLGVRFYRIGYWVEKPGTDLPKLHAEIKARLKDLAAMNREIGVCGVFQNHSSPNPNNRQVGGDLNELFELVRDLNPDELGVAFDLGHAIITHGDDWRARFERLKSHVRVLYVKDSRRPASWVPFGQGEFGKQNFAALLASLNIQAPLSLHIEFEWAPAGKQNREALVKALKESRQMLGNWLQGG